MKRIALLLAAAGVWMALEVISAQASWTVALPGTPRAQAIRAMDIHSRPNRPLHIYGTMVRRQGRG
ncbi:MAG: hypothetical protein JSS27_20655 [Planctomycetes bacterium]|nr:hypothetical protein [Planctomycetota bacterium]